MELQYAIDLTDGIVLGAYVAMALELATFSVPSVASTRQRLRRVPPASLAGRIATVLPIGALLFLFMLPPLLALVPSAAVHLMPIRALAIPEVRWGGVLLLLLGKLLVPLSLPPLRRAIRQGQLARSGAFAYSRHPGLVGMFAFYLGAALIYPCGVLFAGFLLCVWHMHRCALIEEAFLHTHFPCEYAEYSARVPRYVGLM